jgi:ribosome maturation factor RimP
MEAKELENLVVTALGELGFDDCFVVNIRIQLPKIEIFLDSDTEVSFLKCQKVSRWLEARFDESKVFGERYVLEVSSAGVGSPLVFTRQYVKNTGRLIDVKYGEDQRVKGKLTGIQDEIITVEYETTVKEGKKNKKVNIKENIALKDIKEAKIKISFNG